MDNHEARPAGEPARGPATEPAGEPAATPVGRKSGKGLLWGLLAVVLAFLAGFGWQYYRATQIEVALEQAEAELRVERIRVGLAQAALDAQAGEFESARTTMSRIFTQLQEERDQLPPELRDHAATMLELRDDVITGLSRSNPAYVTILYDFLRGFSMAPPGTGTEPAATGPATTGPGGDAPDTGTTGVDGGG